MINHASVGLTKVMFLAEIGEQLFEISPRSEIGHFLFTWKTVSQVVTTPRETSVNSYRPRRVNHL